MVFRECNGLMKRLLESTVICQGTSDETGQAGSFVPVQRHNTQWTGISSTNESAKSGGARTCIWG